MQLGRGVIGVVLEGGAGIRLGRGVERPDRGSPHPPRQRLQAGGPGAHPRTRSRPAPPVTPARSSSSSDACWAVSSSRTRTQAVSFIAHVEQAGPPGNRQALARSWTKGRGGGGGGEGWWWGGGGGGRRGTGWGERSGPLGLWPASGVDTRAGLQPQRVLVLLLLLLKDGTAALCLGLGRAGAGRAMGGPGSPGPGPRVGCVCEDPSGGVGAGAGAGR